MRPRRPPGPDDPTRTTIVAGDGAPPTVVEEEEVGPPPPRPPLLWPWLLLLLLLVLGGLAAAYFLTRDNDHHKKGSSPAAVTVPNVVGMKEAAATEQLRQRGLDPRVLTKPSKAAKGTVFAQTPGAGTSVAPSSPVELSVSAISLTKVPNVVGLKTAAAVSRLKGAGLGAQVVMVAGTKPAGTVLSQTPPAPRSVGKGSTVVLKVSRGTATVPDVVGQQLADAGAALRTAGLKPAVFRVPNAASKGTVIAQKPAAGSKVSRGSKVRINVSTGSQTPAPTTTGGTTTTSPRTTTTGPRTTTTSAAGKVKVPKVVGLQQGPAQRRLHNAGLGSRVLYVSAQAPSGQVVSQGPTAGVTVKRGARVTIRVSLGPSQTKTTVVPDVVGNDQQTATSTLRSAGFAVQVIQVPVTDPSQAGMVVDEQPSGGSRAPTGSQVTIYVGQPG